MFRKLPIFLVVIPFAAGCSQTPVAPTSTAAVGSRLLEAKPGGGPSPTPHMLTFGPSVGCLGDDCDGLPSPGHLIAVGLASGWITGSAVTGNVRVSASGPFTLTVTDAAPLPPEVSTGNPCTPDQKQILLSAGVLGAPVSGSLTLTVDQDQPVTDWLLSGVAGLDGNTWHLHGGSTTHYLPFIEGGSVGLTVTLENGDMAFVREGGNSRRSSLVVGCRVDFTMTMTPQ